MKTAEEGSCSPEEFSENEETSKTVSLSEDEVEELCDKLEINRQERECQIEKKLDSFANLSFYPSRTASNGSSVGRQSCSQ